MVETKIELAWPSYRPYAYVLAALWVLTITLGVIAVFAGAALPAAATDDPDANATDTETETPDPETDEQEQEQDDADEQDDEGEVIASDDRVTVDSDLDVVEWEYDASNERFLITFESDRIGGSRISMSEQVDTERGVTRFNIEQIRVSGTETVEFEARTWQGEAGVSVISEQSLEETGTGVIISTGERSGDDPFDTSGRMAWFGGAGVALLTGIVAFRRRLFGGDGKPKSAWGEW